MCPEKLENILQAFAAQFLANKTEQSLLGIAQENSMPQLPPPPVSFSYFFSYQG